MRAYEMKLLQCLIYLTAFLLAGPALGFGGSFSVYPTRLELSPEKPNDVIMILNGSEREMDVQVSLMEWSQDEKGADKFEESDDLVFFPRLFKLTRDKERVLRVGGTDLIVAEEKTYRLFVEELPIAVKGQGSALTMALRFSLPIFIVPAEGRADLRIEGVARQDGEILARVSNLGNVHAQVAKVHSTLRDPEGKTLFQEEKNGWYLLAGRSKSYSFGTPGKFCSIAASALLSVEGSGLSHQAQVDLAPRSCP